MFDAVQPADPAAEVLRDAALRARSVASDLAVSTRLTQRAAAWALIDEARGAGLIVVGSHGRSGLRGLVAGSVGAHVAALASCPVVVVRPTDGASAAEPTPGARARVVVGIDRSPSSVRAIGFAFRAAAQRGIPLAAVHAWTPDAPTGYGAHPGRPTMAEAMARRAVEKALSRWRDEYADVPVRTTFACGDPARALVAASRGAALLVVGSRGRGHLRRAVLGPVARSVMRHARCPIAIVHDGCGSAATPPADRHHGIAS
jgi:nucleotide-binding universal stress UspA family protein